MGACLAEYSVFDLYYIPSTLRTRSYPATAGSHKTGIRLEFDYE